MLTNPMKSLCTKCRNIAKRFDIDFAWHEQETDIVKEREFSKPVNKLC